MHGSSEPILILNLSPMSEEEIENERLREIARSSHHSMSGEYDGMTEQVVTIPMLLESSDGCGCRSPDEILFEHMEQVESQHFDKKRMPDFARAMGASDEEIQQFEMQLAMEDAGEMMEPKSLSRFKQNYKELKRFGGDPLAVAMSRDVGMPQMSGKQMDEMLSVSMDSTSMMDMSDPMNQAMAALEEEFGGEAKAMMEGESDGYILFSVDCPKRGLKKYIYDSRDGVGTVIGG